MVRGDMPPLEREQTAAGLMAGIPHLPVTVGGAVDREPSELGRVAEAPAASTASEPFTVSTAQDGMAPVFTPTASPPDMGGTTAKADDKDDVDEAVHPPPTSADSQGTNTIDAIGAIDFAISEEELISMRALSRVIGRSPRTVKRFINTYRLFKAMRIPPGAGAGLTEPYGPDDIAAHHVPIMILLAIQIGHPDVAFHLFGAFDAALEADDSQTIGQVVKKLQMAVPAEVNPYKWKVALDSFHSVHDLWGNDPTLIDIGIVSLDPWLLGTSRFGFKEWLPQADRLWG